MKRFFLKNENPVLFVASCFSPVSLQFCFWHLQSNFVFSLHFLSFGSNFSLCFSWQLPIQIKNPSKHRHFYAKLYFFLTKLLLHQIRIPLPSKKKKGRFYWTLRGIELIKIAGCRIHVVLYLILIGTFYFSFVNPF